MEIGGTKKNNVVGMYTTAATNANVGVILPDIYLYATLPVVSGPGAQLYWPGTIAYTSDQGYYYFNGTAWVLFGGGTGSGTVTSVAITTDGSIVSTGGPITVSGSINLALPTQVGLTPGTYSYPTITVNADGIVTAAAAGSAPGTGTVTTFSASSSTLSASVATATTTPALTINLPVQGGITPGTYNNSNTTIDAYGRVTAVSTGSAGGSGTTIYISSLTSAVGIYPNSATDSRAGFQTLLNTYAGTATNLILDCLLTLNYQTSIYGTYMNSVFVPSGSRLFGVRGVGVLSINSLSTPAFTFAHTKDYWWEGFDILYTANPGVTYIGCQTSPGVWGSDVGNYNNITLQNYLQTTFGNTYSNQHPLWSGSGVLLTIVTMRGQSYGTMRNLRVRCPANCSPSMFPQNWMIFANEYCPGITVTSSTSSRDLQAMTFTGPLSAGATSATLASNPQNSGTSWQCTFASGEVRVVTLSSATGTGVSWTTPLLYPTTSASIWAQANQPGECVFDNVLVDGFQMGYLLGGVATFKNCEMGRYTDFCDGTNGQMVLAAIPAAGATSGNLSSTAYPSGWPYASGQYAMSMPLGGQPIFVTATQGSLNITWATSMQLNGQPYANATSAQMATVWNFNSSSGTSVASYMFANGFSGTFPTNGVQNGSGSVTFASNWTASTGIYPMVTFSISAGSGMFWVSCTNGSSSATLSGGPSGGWSGNMTFSSNEVRAVTISQTGAVSWTGALGGASNVQLSSTVTIPYGLIIGQSTATMICGLVAGGVSNFTAPPHAFYTICGSNQQYKMNHFNTYDSGPFVPSGGNLQRRNTGSGYINSIKTSSEGGSIIDGYYSSRPEGGVAIYSNGSGLGATFKNLSITNDTSTPTLDGNVYANFPSVYWATGPTTNLTGENWKLMDLNPSPTQMPLGANGNNLNNNIILKNVTQIMVGDWGGSNFPAVQVTGNNIYVDTSITVATHSSGQNIRGVLFTQTPSINTNSFFNIVFAGWRLLPITFSDQLPVNATGSVGQGGSTLALATAWNYPTGIYTVTFSDNEVRYVGFTNLSTAITNIWNSSYYNQVALTNSSILPAAGHQAQGMLSTNRPSYEMRNGLTLVTTSTQALVRDLTNNISYEFDNNCIIRTQNVYCTVVPPAGTAAFTLPIIALQGDAVDILTCLVTGGNVVTGGAAPANWSSGTAYVPGNAVNSGGVYYSCILANSNQVPPNPTYWTSFSLITNSFMVGYSGLPNAFIIEASATQNVSSAMPWTADVLMPSSQYIVLTPNNGGSWVGNQSYKISLSMTTKSSYQGN